ncbi:MAG: MCE family protein [Cyanobacteria bacterium SIG30]|nr:MCE family protein [Cyanobacteria bacterium SIG30]
MKAQKTSSSIKVGLLTLIAIFILIFTVMWIKGRSLSSGERFEVTFKDVNGIRAGSGVQMMGLRVGQIEEITPVIDGINSRVVLRLVITEKGVEVPPLSTISIQQSGLIGEQFIEITPPRIQTLYLDNEGRTKNIRKEDKIYMEFENEIKPIAKVVKVEKVPMSTLPLRYRSLIKTEDVFKLSYVMTKSDIILDNSNLEIDFKGTKLLFKTKNGDKITYPKEDNKYTIVEPIRMSEFMDLQFQAANSLSETSDKINEILSDDLVFELQESVKNMALLTSKAITTIEKAQLLIDESKEDLNIMFKQTNKLISNLVNLSDSVNKLLGDEDLKTSVTEASKSFVKLSDNINTILEDEQTKEIISNLNDISKNMSEITNYVDEFTKDEKLKKDLKETISGVNNAMKGINSTLESLNELPDGEKIEIKNAIGDILIATRNIKTFSQKLNKRFLLFRLMF